LATLLYTATLCQYLPCWGWTKLGCFFSWPLLTAQTHRFFEASASTHSAYQSNVYL